LYVCCGESKGIAEPAGLKGIPYGIIVLLGSTNTYLPGSAPYPSYTIVWYTTVPVVFVHWNTGEFPGNTAAYVLVCSLLLRN